MRWTRVLGAALALAALTPAYAADHRDGPGVLAEPTADINDVYAFMKPGDPDTLVLAMTVHPLAGANAAFSDAVLYSFNIIQAGDEGEYLSIDCTFDAEGFLCSNVDGEVAVGALGEDVSGGGLRVWAGLRDDPFFFDLNAFLKAVGKAEDVPGFCLLEGRETGTDFFAGLNTLAIVVEIDKALVTADNTRPTLRIWGSTTRLED